jgi:biotin-(acetyl-CoA carboxylase) ligase
MRGHRILIGIGLNVWTDLTHAPPLVNMMAASVASIATSHCDEETLRLLIPAILGRLDLALNRLVAGDASLAADWRRLDLLRDTWIRVELGSRVIAGVAREIDASGCLCIMEGPDERRIMAGQVLRDHRPLR